MSDGRCEVCGGRGWIVDVATNRARRCVCHATRVRRRRMDGLGVPAKYSSCRLSNFRLAGDRDGQLLNARSACERYIEDFLELDGSLGEAGLLFIGPSGRGKTHLAVAVLIELARQYGVRGRFVDFTSLVADIQATFQPEVAGSQAELLRPLTEADVVVVDELGARRPTPFVSDTLYLLINGRYMARRPTLFTSNFYLSAADEPDRGDEGGEAGGRGFSGASRHDRADRPVRGGRGLNGRVSESLVSRLHQMAKPIYIDAVGDYRRELQAHQHR